MPARQMKIAVAFAVVSSCDAFALHFGTTPPQRCLRHLSPMMQEMGDAADPEPTPEVIDASDEPVPISSPDPEPQQPVVETSLLGDLDDFDDDEGSIAKDALKAEVAEGLAGPKPDRAVLGEILLALESQNPTRSPATSPLLNGKWKFLYASGASPGLKGLQLLLKSAKNAPKSPSGADLVDVRETFLTIKEEQPRVEATVGIRVLSLENELKLVSKLEAESAVRLVETYDAAESQYMSLRLPFQSPIQYKRSVLISYLDDEMMVVRDALGRPDVLTRCEGLVSAVGDDTSADDDAPGAS